MFTKLEIESLQPETTLLPVMVTHVISPELFCVSILDNKNLSVLSVSTDFVPFAFAVCDQRQYVLLCDL